MPDAEREAWTTTAARRRAQNDPDLPAKAEAALAEYRQRKKTS